MKHPEYKWDPKLGIASCTIYYKNLKFVGMALCHPEDEDMKSKLTGQTIAETRAVIKSLVHIRDNEIKPQLQALLQYYYSINHSKYFDPKSYEAKMLYRQITMLKEELAEIKAQIKNMKTNLKKYIDFKEQNHNIIREHRAKKSLAKNNQ